VLSATGKLDLADYFSCSLYSGSSFSQELSLFRLADIFTYLVIVSLTFAGI
jgi:hypothetical protein